MRVKGILMKNDFHEEMVDRLAERKTKKGNSWLSLLFKILILFFLVILMKNLGSVKNKKQDNLSNQIEMQTK